MKPIFCCFVCLAVFIGAAAAQKFPTTCADGSTPHFPSASATPIDGKCGLKGAPPPDHPEDGLQNQSKNNFCATGSAAASIHISEMALLQKKAENQEKISGFTPGQAPPRRAFLKKLGEGRLVVFEGYVFQARQECKETVNCGLNVPNVNASHDIHIALLEKPRQTRSSDPKAAQDKEECTGFVAEMIPHHRPAEWTACNVNDVADKGLRVRVTGQEFFDGSHVPCKKGVPQGSNPKRVSLWEIHPIYSFEVCPSGDCANGGWQPLQTFATGKTSCAEQKNCLKKKKTATKKKS